MIPLRRFLHLLHKHPGFRLAKYELGLYRDLMRWARRKTLVPEGATALPHQPGRIQMLAMISAVLVIEAIVVHLVLPAGPIRIVALLLSLWAVVYVSGLIAAERIRPSYFDEKIVVFRRGRTSFAKLPTASIRSVVDSPSLSSSIEIADGVLTLGGPAGTDTLICLTEDVLAYPDRYPWQRPAPQSIRQIRFYRGETAAVPSASSQ